MLQNLNFRRQLFALLIIIVLAMVALIASSLWGLHTLAGNVETIYQSGAKPIRALGEVASRLPRMRVGIDVMFLEEVGMGGDKTTAVRVKEAREEDIPAMRDSINRAVQAQVDPERAAQITQMQDAFSVMEREALQPMLTALEDGRRDEAKAIYGGTYAKQYRALRDELNKALDQLVEDASAEHTGAQADYRKAKITTLTVSLIALSLALLLGGSIMYRLSRRVQQLEQQMEDAASRLALDSRSTLSGNDELARIGRSYNHLMSILDSTVASIQQFTQRVNHTVHTVSGIADEINLSSLAQTDAAQSTAASVEQVAVSVQLVADNSNLAAQQSEAVQEKAIQGTRSLQETHAQFQSITSTLDHASAVTAKLADRSTSISSIVNVIREIAEQTNLLALNAAIEAARAGELGRGFAVVADEVRKLAERTSSATSEIGSLLQGIHEEISEVVSTMQQGQQQMHSGESLVSSAQAMVEAIRLDASNASQNVRSIADSTREQGSAANAIAVRIEQIVQMADRNNGSIGQAQHSVAELAKLAEDLQAQLARFHTTH
jgi:methyl-accepting chemotaxis protein